jgi:hypothetical protein
LTVSLKSEINNRIHISLTSENIRKHDNIDIGEEINTNKEILSIKYIDIDQDMQYVCPIYQQQANMDTIACEECDDWFHFMYFLFNTWKYVVYE